MYRKYYDTPPILVGHQRAAAPHSAAITDAERKLSMFSVLAVVVGRCPDLEIADVARHFARQFQLHESSVMVILRAPREYIILFGTMEARNMAV
jgi:hypothetical protein